MTDNQSNYKSKKMGSNNNALRGEISVKEEAVSELRPYLFTINKLQPSLSAILGSE